MRRAITPAELERPTSLALFELDAGAVRQPKVRTPGGPRERRWPQARTSQTPPPVHDPACGLPASLKQSLPDADVVASACNDRLSLQQEVAGRAPLVDGVSDLGMLPVVPPRPTIRLIDETCTSLLRANDSAELPYPLSINPYRGCEHACPHCPVTPVSHGAVAALGTWAAPQAEPGSILDVVAKRNAVERLRLELRRPGYRPRPLCLGSAADAYQPVERRLRLTRGLIEVLGEACHPFGVATRSAGVVRDLDLLQPLGARGLVLVLVSLATLDPALAARLEPGASSPALRLAAIRNLSRAGVWVGVNLSPLLPGVNDSEVDALADAAAQAGAHALCWQGRLADAASHLDMQARLAQLREAHGWAHELPTLDTSQFRPPAAPVVVASAVQRQKSLF